MIVYSLTGIFLVFLKTHASFATEIDCGFPGLPFLGQFSGKQLEWDSVHPVGSVVTYGCEKSLTLKGSRQRRCEPSGRWSGDLPQCVDDMTHLHSTLRKRRSSRSTVQRKRSIPEDCKEVSNSPCGVPEMPSRGKRQLYRDKNGIYFVTYDCNIGYCLQGNGIRTCGEGKKWNGTQAVCKPEETGSSGQMETTSASTSTVQTESSTSTLIPVNGSDNIENIFSALLNKHLTVLLITAFSLLLFIVGGIFICRRVKKRKARKSGRLTKFYGSQRLLCYASSKSEKYSNSSYLRPNSVMLPCSGNDQDEDYYELIQ